MEIKSVITNNCQYIYAIENNSKPIGWLEIIKSDNKNYLLQKIFVLPEHRNNGIATKLIKKFLESINNCFIRLEVVPDVNDFSEITKLQEKLIKYYEKFGFKLTRKIFTPLFYIPEMSKYIK